MAVTFARTLRSLEADGRGSVAGWVLVSLAVAWGAWFGLGRVTVHEVTERAWLEARSAAHPVAAQVGGLVVETRLAVGREVQAGEALVVLDGEPTRLAIGERRARRDALAARLEALRREIATVRQGAEAERAARQTAVDESKARAAEAEAKARLAERQAARVRVLRARGAASEEEDTQNRAAAEAARDAARALALGATRLEQDRRVREIDRAAHLAELEHDAIELRGDLAAQEAAILRLEDDLRRRTVRAPVTGRVGEAAPEFRVGSVVRAADRLGAIVPTGSPRAVALFPAAAVGRIRPGQPARLRLDGFAWTQYGTIPAVVAEVGNEPSDGRIRVELSLRPGLVTPIPVGHGLPGSAEVAIEQVTPAHLVVRAAGQFLGVRRAAAPGPSPRRLDPGSTGSG
jgi:membrane fusion protein (multidrug efflux system)